MRWGYYIGLSLVMACLIEGAPGRSKSSSKKSTPHTVFDQKQHGDYNIQVHLKDFQIIALMSDDLGGLGDYDYNYDYSDFTVKPSGSSSTTTSATTTNSIVTSSQPASPSPTPASSSPSIAPSLPLISTLSPSVPPISASNNLSLISSITSSVSSSPLLVSSSTTSSERPNSLIIGDSPPSIKEPTEESITQTVSVENKPSTVVISDTQPVLLTSSNTSTVFTKLSTSKPSQSSANSTLYQEISSPVSSAAPDKIKVQIIGAPQAQAHQGSLSVIPGEEINGSKPASSVAAQQQDSSGHVGQQGGHHGQKEKRCLTGFTRDKWGRCRRVRRPGGGGGAQIPFDINRLASLATRFRLGAPETAPHIATEEDD